jgi:hypothetical protein
MTSAQDPERGGHPLDSWTAKTKQPIEARHIVAIRGHSQSVNFTVGYVFQDFISSQEFSNFWISLKQTQQIKVLVLNCVPKS